VCAVAVGAVSACGDSGSVGEHDKASCVAPFIRSDAKRSPPDPGAPTTFGSVRPGQHLSLHGWYYYGSACDDTNSGVPAARSASALPVHLTLTTADHRTVALAAPRATGNDASFVVSVAVPATAAAGPASIGDGQGHVVKLDVTTG
jgi:hypothetical protein